MADVSMSTVSRVINNDKYVSEKTREAVKKIINETGYVVNGNAVKLSKGRSGVIGVQIPYNNSCYDQLIDSILLTTKEKGYQVQLLPTYYEEEAENYYYSMLEQKLIDGLVLTSRTTIQMDWNKLLSKGKLVSTEKINDPLVPVIAPDREKIYDTVFSYLQSLDSEDVIFTAKRDADQSITTRNKIRVYEKYFGKAEKNLNYFIGIDRFENGYEWANELVGQSRIPKYIYVNGDNTGAGILRAFQENGWKHKKDFHLIGEGNESYSKILDFSTIDFSPIDIGRESVEFLLSDLETVRRLKKPKIIFR